MIDTEAIWNSLGSFYGKMFPVDERVYWSTFWEAWGDITADLWGYAFQIDRAKSLYSTTATIERREVLAGLRNLDQTRLVDFRISVVKQNSSGKWIIRGFVPRDLRNFKEDDVPDSGTIRIGVDILDYVQVDIVVEETGIYAGFVREATFVLDGALPRDYSDDPEINESFDPDPSSQLKIRVDHSAGDTIVDTVLIDPTSPITVNPTGTLVLGAENVNRETVDYKSVSIIADRYIFTLVDTWQSPATSPQDLAFAHLADESLTVNRHDDERWSSSSSGWGRVTANGSAVMTIDNDNGGDPMPASSAILSGQYQLKDNVDFDVSTRMDITAWEDMTGTGVAEKRSVARLNIGSSRYTVGIEQRRDGGGTVTDHLVFGEEGSELDQTIEISDELSLDLRFKRIGGTLEFLYRDIDATQDFTKLGTLTVSGQRATMDLLSEDSGTDTYTVTVFDEVIRRAGEVAGSARLEEFFQATSSFPYVYESDVNILSADDGLRDSPRIRSEQMITALEINNLSSSSIAAIGADGFEPEGVPDSGFLTIENVRHIYNGYERDGDLFTFELRNKIDPGLVPVSSGSEITIETRTLQPREFNLPGNNIIELRELPTRDSMWAPVAQSDISHIQNHYGVLTDLSSDVSTETYLRRVQGVWAALMLGPSIRNVHSGLSLNMGLPAALVDGTVDAIIEERDALGRLTLRQLNILGENGIVEHQLRTDIPLIDWTVDVGQEVERFQPLTDGVEVLDVVEDPLWHQRFPGVSDAERWNTFGVFIALEALNADANADDAIRFALRIKPTWTKLVIRFLLTTSGNEDLSGDLDDDTFARMIPLTCEDMSFDEGDPPADPAEIYRLGDGHKLGQGKSLGGSGLWNFNTLEHWVTLATGSGLSITAGSDVVTTTLPHGASPGDVLYVPSATASGDIGLWKVDTINSPTEMVVWHTFSVTESSLDWEVRDYLSLGEGATLGMISAFKCFVGHDQNLPTEFLDAQQIVNMTMVP